MKRLGQVAASFPHLFHSYKQRFVSGMTAEWIYRSLKEKKDLVALMRQL
jgi:hypothetical protein